MADFIFLAGISPIILDEVAIEFFAQMTEAGEQGTQFCRGRNLGQVAPQLVDVGVLAAIPRIILCDVGLEPGR